METELDRGKETSRTITPAEMAASYWNRLHFKAIGEAIDILKEHPVESTTGKYWREVLRHLRAKVGEVHQKRRLPVSPSGNA